MRLGLTSAIALIGSIAALSQPASPPLTSLGQVLKLTNEDAQNGFAFRIRAQVTLFDPLAYWFFLQDHSHGIYAILAEKNAPPQVGDWVEAEGVTGRGGFAPILDIRKLKVTGHGPRPVPLSAGDPDRKIPEAGNLWAV